MNSQCSWMDCSPVMGLMICWKGVIATVLVGWFFFGKCMDRMVDLLGPKSGQVWIPNTLTSFSIFFKKFEVQWYLDGGILPTKRLVRELMVWTIAFSTTFWIWLVQEGNSHLLNQLFKVLEKNWESMFLDFASYESFNVFKGCYQRTSARKAAQGLEMTLPFGPFSKWLEKEKHCVLRCQSLGKTSWVQLLQELGWWVQEICWKWTWPSS